MDALQHEQYEYARNRIRQKKRVLFHFALFFIGSVFLFIINKGMNIGEPENWYLWAVSGWGFVFILHCIRVFVTDSFMNKNWERHQVDKLVAMQQRKIQNLRTETEQRINENN